MLRFGVVKVAFWSLVEIDEKMSSELVCRADSGDFPRRGLDQKLDFLSVESKRHGGKEGRGEATDKTSGSNIPVLGFGDFTNDGA